MSIKADFSMSTIDFNSEQCLMEMSRTSYGKLMTNDMDYSAWASYPNNMDSEFLEEIVDTARCINEQCTLFVVVGIGGSYLGAKAVIDALGGSATGCAEVIFAGYSMSAAYLAKIEERMRRESTCLCVISKSGRTVEPMLVYNILKDVMQVKYGMQGAARRIFVVTDRSSGILRKEAELFGYKSFDVPTGIGGRYSVLTPVGLFPIAVAGYDIGKLIEGAAGGERLSCADKKIGCTGEKSDCGDGRLDCTEEKSDCTGAKACRRQLREDVIRYATCRNRLQATGKDIEIFEYFEANLKYFGEWLKQLFAESEGKDGKGAYPTSLCFSRDLHSVGQFLQQGKQVFYETMIRIERPNFDFTIPDAAGEPFAGKSLEQINACSEEGVIRAHSKAGIPIVTITVPVLDEYCLGELIYFFEMACAVSAMNNGVNPFDQPGVEAYKEEMIKLVEEL